MLDFSGTYCTYMDLFAANDLFATSLLPLAIPLGPIFFALDSAPASHVVLAMPLLREA